MSANDEDNDLLVVVSYLLKRQVRMQEMTAALKCSRSSYYEQRERGVLTGVPNLMAVAEHFQLDKIDLLVRFGHLNSDDMLTYLESQGEVVTEVMDGVVDPPVLTTTKPTRILRRQSSRSPKARTDIPSL